MYIDGKDSMLNDEVGIEMESCQSDTLTPQIKLTSLLASRYTQSTDICIYKGTCELQKVLNGGEGVGCFFIFLNFSNIFRNTSL